jgi:methylenetetrahydrofolate dehydrogenase (NADP+)/methenyltetrahydrofolate cyclohydrolase
VAVLDGKTLAAKIQSEVKRDVSTFLAETGIQPGLATVRVGANEASRVYVNRKAKACTEVGILSRKIEMPQETTEGALLEVIDGLNRDHAIHGILVQLPLPKHISTDRVLATVLVDKDVDGFHIVNVGRLAAGQPGFVPCTPLGVMRMLDEYDISVEGADAVVVGRSQIVGKPLVQLLLARHATVTVCHSRTKNLPEVCRRADILVAAIGKAEMVRGDWIKAGATVIDVGINRKDDGTLVGDVAFEEAKQRAGWITPVPGGVGPLTIAMLLSNTLKAAKEQSRVH